jgi:hypothetical protein
VILAGRCNPNGGYVRNSQQGSTALAGRREERSDAAIQKLWILLTKLDCFAHARNDNAWKALINRDS